MNNIKIYNEFNENLVDKWQKLFTELKGDYNLSPDWCFIWFKHFGNKNRKLFIYTVWEEDELKAVAPFYLSGKELNPIGTKPGFYDEFNLLSFSETYTKEIVTDIINKQLKTDLRLVNPESDFIKLLFREVENKRLFTKKIYFGSLKFKADTDFAFDKSFAHRIKRKITSSNNKFKEKLNFEFETDKNSGHFEEMLFWHKKKWTVFRKKENEYFIKDMFYNTDLLFLSRLSHENSNNSISFQLSYRSFDKITITASSYNPVYEVVSPSLLIHYNFFNEGFKKGYSYIDFGIGAHAYKYNFANSASVIMSLKTSLSFLKKYDFLYLPLKELKLKLESIKEAS